MAHAQKPDVVFRAKLTSPFKSAGGRQFSRLLAAEVCSISGSNAGYTMFRGSVKGTGYPLHSPVSHFTSPPVRHRVPSHFNWAISIDSSFGAKRTSPFKSSRRASVQSTAGSRDVRISVSNAGYTMFRVSMKSTGYPLHSPVSHFTSPPVRHRVPSHFNWAISIDFIYCTCVLTLIPLTWRIG